MSTGLRFFLAMILMLLVFVVTNRLFPPVLPEPPGEAAGPETGVGREGGLPEGVEAGEDRPDALGERGLPVPGEDDPEELVTVETPLYRIVFSNRGGIVRSIRLLGYESFAREGPVELVPPGAAGVLAGTWQVGSAPERFELTRLSYDVSPREGIRLGQGSGPRVLTFRFEHPTQPFVSEIRYTFSADSYIIGVEGRLPASERAAMFVDLGPGLAVNELREAEDRRMMAFSVNHVDEGIRSRPFARVDEAEAMPGPLRWAAVKSKYFVEVILAGEGSSLAGAWAEPVAGTGRAAVRVGMPVDEDGGYAYRAYLGPIDRDLLAGVGDDLHEGQSDRVGVLPPDHPALCGGRAVDDEDAARTPPSGLRMGADRDRLPGARRALAVESEGDAVTAEEHGGRAVDGGDQEEVRGRSAEDAAGDDEVLQGAGHQPACRVRSPADSLAHADRVVLRVSEHDSAPGPVLHVAGGPLGAGPLLHPAHLSRGEHVRSAVDQHAGDGDREPADEDDDVYPAPCHAVDLLASGLGAEPLLRQLQSGHDPAADPDRTRAEESAGGRAAQTQILSGLTPRRDALRTVHHCNGDITLCHV